MEYNQKHFAKTEKHFSLFGIIVKVEDEPLNNISVKSAVSKALSLLPNHLRKNVNNIFIGDFDRLKKRDFEAMYENGNIFLVNTHHNEDDMVDDIVHEFAHSIYFI